MSLKKEDVKHIANLAKLEMTEGEIEKLTPQLSGVLDYIEQLREVDTTGVEPTAQVTGLENIYREDVAEDWANDEREQALNQAPLEDRYIKVKRVLN